MIPPTQPLSVLVVEDDPLAQKVMSSQLRGHEIDLASNAASARKKLEDNRYDICFIDLKLGENDNFSGLDLIPIAVAKQVFSVVMSGNDSDDRVDKAYALGCNAFYAKGHEEMIITQVLDRFKAGKYTDRKDHIFMDSFVTQDSEIKAAISECLTYASSSLPILILGPSGTGKTSLARIIHDHSNRPGEFVAINCSAYSEELLEAELFGFRKGAFTGAYDNRQGKLLAADRGTLFLDEIGSMSLKMQAKLLKAIEEHSFYPLGSDKPEKSEFRVISATLEDLQALIKAGKLRFDFFQRIHGLTVRLKPLASHPHDVFPLVNYFTRGSRRISFTVEAKQQLLAYDWPGNIRELKKLVDLLAAGQEGRVTPEILERMMKALRLDEKSGEFVTQDQYHFAKRYGLNDAIDRFVDRMIERSLNENGGKRTKVLDELKIKTRILYTSLNRQHIPVKEGRQSGDAQDLKKEDRSHALANQKR